MFSFVRWAIMEPVQLCRLLQQPPSFCRTSTTTSSTTNSTTATTTSYSLTTNNNTYSSYSASHSLTTSGSYSTPLASLTLSALLQPESSMNNMDSQIIGGLSPDPSMIDSNLEPQSRARCNTWPLRPIDPPSVQESEGNPLSAEGPIQEEPEDYLDCDTVSKHNLSGDPMTPGQSTSGLNTSSELGSQGDLSNAKKSASSRKNAWGNLSYAELITKAIQSAPEKRLTLSQIYDWMVQNVAYFRDKGDSNSSAGWKNSIRHNLSLHNRFMRIQNEGAGKSSWWVINPEAKPGKAPRRPRGGSMDSKSLRAKRDMAMKRVKEKKKGLMRDGTISPASPANNSEFTLSPGDGYRERASSFVSTSSLGGRRSPLHDDLLDSKLSPWGSESHLEPYMSEYAMDTGKLHEDLDLLNLSKLPNSFMDELGELPSNGFQNNAPLAQPMYAKPYEQYTSNSGGNGYSAPPPPYPATDQNQQQFNKVSTQSNVPSLYGKDPMMPTYQNMANSANNNSLSPNQVHRQFTGNMNGVLPAQGTAHRLQNPTQQSQRTMPSSIRMALQGGPPVQRPQVSNSIKSSAPILTQQLMESYQSESYHPQQMNTQQFMQQRYIEEQQQQMSQQQYFPNDLDFSIDEMLPEELSCDIEQVIQREMQLDGGQLDTSGLEGYSQHKGGIFS